MSDLFSDRLTSILHMSGLFSDRLTSVLHMSDLFSDRLTSILHMSDLFSDRLRSIPHMWDLFSDRLRSIFHMSHFFFSDRLRLILHIPDSFPVPWTCWNCMLEDLWRNFLNFYQTMSPWFPIVTITAVVTQIQNSCASDTSKVSFRKLWPVRNTFDQQRKTIFRQLLMAFMSLLLSWVPWVNLGIISEHFI